MTKQKSQQLPHKADRKTGKQHQKNYYAIDHLEVLDGHRLKLWFENGDVKITDVRNALGGEAESPYFAELFENFDKAENIYFGVSWPWPSSKNTYDIKGEDLWGAGIDVAASEPEKQPSLKSSTLATPEAVAGTGGKRLRDYGSLPLLLRALIKERETKVGSSKQAVLKSSQYPAVLKDRRAIAQ